MRDLRPRLFDGVRIWLAAQVARGEMLRRERALNTEFLQTRNDAARLDAVAKDRGWDLDMLNHGRAE